MPYMDPMGLHPRQKNKKHLILRFFFHLPRSSDKSPDTEPYSLTSRSGRFRDDLWTFAGISIGCVTNL